MTASVDAATRDSDWGRWHIAVAGIGIAGFACADGLRQLGARVSVLDAGDTDDHRNRAEILRTVGAEVRLGDGDTLPAGVDLLVVSPGLRPTADVIGAAQAAGVPVWGELELAWRLRPSADPAPWLVVTGTNGKTTTTLMLAAMLTVAGRRTLAAGNIGTSLVDTVLHEDLDVIAVEVGAPQLPFWHTVSPQAAVCLNIAPDHLDHFGSFEAYVAAKARVFERTQRAAVYNVADPATQRLVAEAEVEQGCRAIGITLGVPGPSMLGVVDDVLVDRAFVADRANTAQELATLADVTPMAPHTVFDALAAATLARAYGVPAAAVRDGLQAYRPAAHRMATVAEIGAVRWVDDSKATNAHAARTALRASGTVVWIAGGQAKGQTFDDLVTDVRAQLRAVVLLGADRHLLADALARHAPEVPVAAVDRTETDAMDDAVRLAAGFARPGDTVLLAPACASWDMFGDYAHRGEAFATAVRALGSAGGSGAAS